MPHNDVSVPPNDVLVPRQHR